jgi:hypothetical protein
MVQYGTSVIFTQTRPCGMCEHGPVVLWPWPCNLSECDPIVLVFACFLLSNWSSSS